MHFIIPAFSKQEKLKVQFEFYSSSKGKTFGEPIIIEFEIDEGAEDECVKLLDTYAHSNGVSYDEYVEAFK